MRASKQTAQSGPVTDGDAEGSCVGCFETGKGTTHANKTHRRCTHFSHVRTQSHACRLVLLSRLALPCLALPLNPENQSSTQNQLLTLLRSHAFQADTRSYSVCWTRCGVLRASVGECYCFDSCLKLHLVWAKVDPNQRNKGKGPAWLSDRASKAPWPATWLADEHQNNLKGRGEQKHAHSWERENSLVM